MSTNGSRRSHWSPCTPLPRNLVDNPTLQLKAALFLLRYHCNPCLVSLLN